MSDTELTAGTKLENGLVAESDLSYEPPSTKPTWNLKDAERSFIDSLVNGTEYEDPIGGAEYDPTALENELTAEDDTYSQEELTPKGGAEEATAAGAQDEEADDAALVDPKLGRGVQRLVQREWAAKEREAAADAREKAATERITELKKYEGLRPTAEISQMMELDPIGAFKALGKDPEVIIKMALAQQLGDSAPDSLKDFARGAAEKREIAAIRAELAQERQARAAQEYFNTVSAGAREYVTKTVGDIKAVKTLPTLSKAAKVDLQYVHDEIMEEIVKEARAKAATDPDGEPLKYEEAAARVEKRLSRLAKLFAGPSMNQGNPKIAQKPNVAPPSTKPAPKPLAPWQQKKTSIDEVGIQEALRAYETAEAERKAQRR
jgi:hypothetical protein